jgi:hypothetical protein
VSRAVCPTIIVAGMHRSGTSLTASLLAGAGIDLGSRLLGAGLGNDRGHFEDLDFKELHGRGLEGWGIGEAGFTCQSGIRLPFFLRARAEALAADRTAAGRPWGWKDPRTVLFLEDWNEILPEAFHVVVFRRPWEVVDSFFRRGDAAFVLNPPFAIAVWLHYNSLLLDFLRRFPRRCLPLEVSQIAADPPRLCRDVRDRTGAVLADPSPVFDERLLRRDVPEPLAHLVCEYAPRALEVYLRLRELAGSSSPLPGPAAGGRRRAVLEQEIRDWAGQARAAAAAGAAGGATDDRTAA